MFKNIVGRLTLRKLAIPAGLVLLVAAVLFLPVTLPYTIKTQGTVQPMQKWVLTRGTDGQLIAGLTDLRTGGADSYRVSQFAREGTMALSVNRDLAADGWVEAGDTVASIYSSDTEETLAELDGRLAAMRATLSATQRGEKQAIVAEYRALLTAAGERLAGQRRILTRMQALLERDLTTQEDFDIAQNEERVLAVEVDVAQAQLAAATSGARPEEVAMIEAQVAAINEEIGALRRRMASFALVSPISGRVLPHYSADTLLVVADVSSCLLFMPITTGEASFVAPEQRVSLRLEGIATGVTGRVLGVDTEVRLLDGRQTRMGLAVIDDGASLPCGAVGRCEVNCRPVTLLEHVKRFLRGV